MDELAAANQRDVDDLRAQLDTMATRHAEEIQSLTARARAAESALERIKAEMISRETQRGERFAELSHQVIMCLCVPVCACTHSSLGTQLVTPSLTRA
jgi:hypothetical protein